MLTFQQVILTLQEYWDAQGCALLQPYDMEVGAGTSHTATFLRAIGPEVRGLLGLNFLRSFRVTLDFEREVLRLTQPAD